MTGQSNPYEADIRAILSHRYDQGGDLWATPDKRLLKGAPFTTLECVQYLLELGVSPDDPVLEETGRLIFSVWKSDGRFRIYPGGALYPCHTILAAETLCLLGWADDPRLRKTLAYLLETQYADGGWRCNKFSYGRGPETEFSNPYPTLAALNAFRFSREFGRERALERAVDFLLEHWRIRRPIGPCHYGIGSLFMQVEYPFRGYNLFFYVYVLSFYDRARSDPRFIEALNALKERAPDGAITVQRVVPKLAGLSFCKKGAVSELASARYQEILINTGGNP